MQQVRLHEGSIFVDKLLETDTNLEFFCSVPVDSDPVRLETELQQLPVYLGECEEFPIVAGKMRLNLDEPILPLYLSTNLEAYSLVLLTHSETVCWFSVCMIERIRVIYNWCLNRNRAEVYFLVGTEMASPPLDEHATF